MTSADAPVGTVPGLEASGFDGSAAAVAAVTATAVLRRVLLDLFPGRVALTSSFGADAVVLLHMVAGIEPATPVLFLETGKLFPETLRYRDLLVDRFGLTDVRDLRPSPASLAARDPDDTLWQDNPDLCCAIRKVVPLDKALEDFVAWITGRKRFHGEGRGNLPVLEMMDDGKIKINPLAAWSETDIETYMRAHALPRHPLLARGYRSIGCATCTAPAEAGGGVRSGRWQGRAKTECGIHLPRASQNEIVQVRVLNDQSRVVVAADADSGCDWSLSLSGRLSRTRH